MSNTVERVMTTGGESQVPLKECDSCGSRTVRKSSYDIEGHWLMVRRLRDPSNKGSHPPTEELDFCSNECLIRFLEPGIYDTDPFVVQQAINKLKRIETDLRSPAASVPY